MDTGLASVKCWLQHLDSTGQSHDLQSLAARIFCIPSVWNILQLPILENAQLDIPLAVLVLPSKRTLAGVFYNSVVAPAI